MHAQAETRVGDDPARDLLVQVNEQLAAKRPLGRTGVTDDVARVALFCASDLSMLMTGSTLLVDAGDVPL